MKTLIAEETPLHPTTKVPLPDSFQIRSLFEDGDPVEVEIGCGRGRFLVQRARENPDVRLIGLDRCSKWMKRGNQKRVNGGLHHLILFKAEVRDFLCEVPAQSVSVFHIYFPDPWPKKKHRKRRLVTSDFLALLWARLKPSGLIELATDDPDYFEQMKASAQQTHVFWRTCRQSISERLAYPDAKTHYELKYEKSGRPLFYLELQKK